MRFKFDHTQKYQLDAIKAVIDLFKALPKQDSRQAFARTGGLQVSNPHVAELQRPGFYSLPLEIVQENNGIDRSRLLDRGVEYDDGQMLAIKDVDTDIWRHPGFSIEMETGTGKTYVYLRTIFELYHLYGFSKFIIVVPSIAIYEGVASAYKSLASDLKNLYGQAPFKFIRFEGGNLSVLRDFAEDPLPQVLLMTLASFNRQGNNIYKTTYKLAGEWRPYQYIQSANPVMVLDEPQSIDNTPLAKSAIRILKPLFTLRYSATHRDPVNLVYALTPAQASIQNLVKKIKVVGVSLLQPVLNGQVTLLGTSSGNGIFARVSTSTLREGKVAVEEITIRQGDNLLEITGNPQHEGYVVENIIAQENEESVYFDNGELITTQQIEGVKPIVFRRQINETIREHIKLQVRLLPQGIKVLSLFFIDKVDNYLGEGGRSGGLPDGLIRRIFEQEYNSLTMYDPYFMHYTAASVQGHYFAKYSKAKGTPDYLDQSATDEKGREAEKEAYRLIMKDKAGLLTLKANGGTEVCFIFAHSALREGWDNPNVFQICTLNQSVSEPRKRQEIGRGLRLCVNQQGQRIQDPLTNVLTVVANESYKSFVENLQEQYEADRLPADAIPQPPSNAKQKAVSLNKNLFDAPQFQDFWQKLTRKVWYDINMDTERLVEDCRLKFNKTQFPPLNLTVESGKMDILEIRISISEFIPANPGVPPAAHLNFSLLSSLKTEERADVKVAVGDRLGSKIFNSFFARQGADRRMIGDFEVEEINTDAYEPFVGLKERNNVTEITRSNPYRNVIYYVEKPKTAQVAVEGTELPVFDLMERAAQATGLTRRTVNAIFKNLTPERKTAFAKNPEAFASIFIDTIRKLLHKQVAENIRFTLKGELPADELKEELARFFPGKRDRTQKELVPGGPKSLYSMVQVDSKVEKRFVENRLEKDEKILLYFKFPEAYKVNLPRLIHNYTPDWGIIREDAQGKPYLELVRETKGSLDKEALRFENEKLKVICAERYFDALGIDYRQITDAEPVRWWEKRPMPGDAGTETQAELSEP